MFRKIVQGFFLALVFGVSTQAHANEDYCLFEIDSHSFNEVECDDENCHFEINLPKEEGLKLHSVELRFGIEPNYIRGNLEYEEFENAYSSVIYFSAEHDPIMVQAIYHQKACFSLVVLEIKGRIVKNITNET